ncbi:MAG: FimV/HubP family polar landmark protein [Congregibacter sp.]
MNAVRAALIACGAAASAPSLALGLGEIEMQSFLNEPLRAQVQLLDTRQLTVDDVRIRLAGGEDFDRLGIERSFFLTSISFEVVIDENTGRGTIKLSTQEPVLEPFLDLIIEARWPSGRLLREYTVLIDPPAFGRDTITVSASDTVAAMEPAPTQPPPRSETRDASTSGDRVQLRGSDLAPGEMPSRAFSAATASNPQAGSRYMVRRDETLWQIASQGKPDGTSVQQAMLEIQRLNPEAFIDGNINRIKAGYIIYLPAAGEISSDDLALALEEVREQNQAWQERRSAPGVTAAASLRVSAEPATTPSVAEASGDLLVSTSGGDSNAVGATVDTPTTRDAGSSGAVGDDAAAMSGELAAKLDAMTQRLDTLEQIVALKDEQIATLEQALREAREAAARPAVAAAPAATTTPAEATATPAAPAPRAAAPAPSSTPFPWIPLAGGALVLMLGGLFFWRRRNAAQAEQEKPEAVEDDIFAGVSLQKDAIAADDSESDDENADTPPAAGVTAAVAAELDDVADAEEGASDAPQTGSRGYGERKHDDYIDEGASGDALAEADIYIAYGRYLQAIELLDTAIENEPGNSAYRVKLIELYVDMGEEQSAAEQMDKLRAHGDEAAIARAEALLGGAVVAPELGSAAPAEPIDESSDDQEELVSSLELELEDELEPDLTSEPDIDPDAVSDTELLRETNDDSPVLETVSEETFDLDVDLDAPELSFADDAAQDLDDQLTAEDLDSDELGEIEFEGLEIEDDNEDPDDEQDVLDFLGGEEELDLSDALVDSETADASDADASTDEGEDLLIAEDADQMATKLDLARAYMDMGDSDGAKVILEEVAAKGSSEQQQEANELLGRIG